MIAVIPAKSTSSRVPDKNWRPFYQEKSLVDIKIDQLSEVMPKQNIYLSCEDISKKEIADQHGINFLLRDPELASDDTGWSDVVTGIVNQLPVDGEEEILWAEVTSPLFSDYGDFIETWNSKKTKYDSIAGVNELREYLMDKNGKPTNFEFGKGHRPSQELEPLYTMDSFFIMEKKKILKLNYVIGNHPYLYIINTKSIEIDTMNEFNLAQKLYEENCK